MVDGDVEGRFDELLRVAGVAGGGGEAVFAGLPVVRWLADGLDSVAKALGLYYYYYYFLIKMNIIIYFNY